MPSIRGTSNIEIFSRVKNDIAQAQNNLARIQRQISTQRRILSPHDDIGATSRVIRLQNILEQQDTFLTTLSYGRTKLEQVDGALSEMNSQIIELQALAIDMADSGASAAQRLASSEVVQQSLDAMVQFANTQVAGQFLFSGFDSSQPPFENVGTEVVFHGDANEVQAQISQGQYLPITLNPNAAFGGLSVEKQGTVDLNPRLSLGEGHIDGHTVTTGGTTTTFRDSTLVGQDPALTANDLIGREVWVSAGTNIGEHGTISGFNPATGEITIDAADAFNAAFDTTTVYSVSERRPGTALESLNSSTGVQAGSIRISLAASPTSVTVDLTQARTLTDVKEKIEAADSRLRVGLNAARDGLTVTDTSGTSITIASVNGVTTAEDLGIAGTNAGGTITGTDVNPALREETLLSDLSGGALTLGSIYVINGSSRTGAIDLSTQVDGVTATQTIGDVLTKINNAVTSTDQSFHIDASINSSGTGLNILSRVSGADFSISRNAVGDTTPDDLGLVTMTGNVTVNTLRNGRGLDFAAGSDFNIFAGGTSYTIDLNSTNAQTIQNILDQIGAQTGGAVTATINNVQGNRIELNGPADMFVESNGSNVAEQLGFTLGQVGATLQGTDVASLKVDSIFTSVADFYNGLVNNDQAELFLAEGEMDDAFDQLLQGRARAGGRLIRIELTENRINNERLFVQEDLSNNLDIDLAEAITDLQTQELVLQTTFATSARIFDLSLVNFI